MTIAPPEVRAARELLARHRKAQRLARPKPVLPLQGDGQRQPRVREPLYLAWIRRLPCAGGALGDCGGPIEAAHVRFSDASTGRRNPGMQSKPSDRLSVPLCTNHHRAAPNSQHSMNESRFWAILQINPSMLMRDLSECYDKNGDGAMIVNEYGFAKRTGAS